MRNPDLYKERPWFKDLQPTGAPIVGYTPVHAEALFLARFAELWPESNPVVEIE
jgi:hypothetical protein